MSEQVNTLNEVGFPLPIFSLEDVKAWVERKLSLSDIAK